MSFLQLKSAHLLLRIRKDRNDPHDVEKNRGFTIYNATYPHQLSKTFTCKHIPNRSLSKRLTCIHINNPRLSKRFTCKHIHNPKSAESRTETGFEVAECKLKVLNAILKYLNY